MSCRVRIAPGLCALGVLLAGCVPGGGGLPVEPARRTPPPGRHGPALRRVRAWRAAQASSRSDSPHSELRSPNSDPRTPKTPRGQPEPTFELHTLAVAPVVDLTGEPHAAGPDALGRQIAGALVAAGWQKVIYPPEIAAAMQERARPRRIPVTDELLPAGADSRAVDAAASLDADAVLVVQLLEYRPYPPPRVVLRARLYRTDPAGELASDAILQMTDDGVPADIPARPRSRFLWASERVLDARQQVAHSKLAAFAGSLQSVAGSLDMDAHRLTRSMDRYLAFCAHVLANDLKSHLQGARFNAASEP